MLTSSQIKNLGLIVGSSNDGYRATSYDLHAGKIIKPGGTEVSEYLIPPQGIVEIVSKERIKLPANVCGFATVKTGLSTNGLLALNIGIIDPCYDGPLSSFFVNFSKVDFLISEDEIFLRTHYVTFKSDNDDCSTISVSTDAYIREKKNKIAGRFGTTFLNVDDIVSVIIRGYALKALAYVGAVALVITFCSFLANVGVLTLMRSSILSKTSPDEDVKRQLKNQTEKSESEIRSLDEKIHKMEMDFRRFPKSGPIPQGKQKQ